MCIRKYVRNKNISIPESLSGLVRTRSFDSWLKTPQFRLTERTLERPSESNKTLNARYFDESHVATGCCWLPWKIYNFQYLTRKKHRLNTGIGTFLTAGPEYWIVLFQIYFKYSRLYIFLSRHEGPQNKSARLIASPVLFVSSDLNLVWSPLCHMLRPAILDSQMFKRSRRN